MIEPTCRFVTSKFNGQGPPGRGELCCRARGAAASLQSFACSLCNNNGGNLCQRRRKGLQRLTTGAAMSTHLQYCSFPVYTSSALPEVVHVDDRTPIRRCRQVVCAACRQAETARFPPGRADTSVNVREVPVTQVPGQSAGVTALLCRTRTHLQLAMRHRSTPGAGNRNTLQVL